MLLSSFGGFCYLAGNGFSTPPYSVECSLRYRSTPCIARATSEFKWPRNKNVQHDLAHDIVDRPTTL